MYNYDFFIEWRNENTSSSIEVTGFDIKDNALFLYSAKEKYHEETPAVFNMVIPFSSMRYFTYECVEE